MLDAGSGRTLIEATALRIHRGNKWFEVHVCGDVSDLVQQTLALPRYGPACDHLFKWWASETVHVRLIPDYAPCIKGPHIACQNEIDFQKAMVQIRDTLGVKQIRIWRDANIIDDWRGVDSLRRIGIDYEEFCGPGPGHCDSIYEVMLCDPQNWVRRQIL